ncbi:MAG: hypothetical protein ACR2P2_08585, partial [Nakamurella sp.]
ERVARQYASGHILSELETGDQPRRPGDLGDASANEQADAAQAAHDDYQRERIAAEEDAR